MTLTISASTPFGIFTSHVNTIVLSSFTHDFTCYVEHLDPAMNQLPNQTLSLRQALVLTMHCSDLIAITSCKDSKFTKHVFPAGINDDISTNSEVCSQRLHLQGACHLNWAN
jgi:hypothetical protein